MIHTNIKLGIVYCNNSMKYANELSNIIKEYRKNGYCIEPIIINKDLVDNERSIEKRVFNNLDKCDFAFIFFTKDIQIADNKDYYISKPNVLLELGYFLGKISWNNIYIIIDFPYSHINHSYLLPSDIPDKFLEEIDKNNSKSTLSVLFERFINANINAFVRLEEYNANNLIQSILLNQNYRTNYQNLFTQAQSKSIEKLSIEWQLEEILDIWIEEKITLSNIEQIMYLFERIVFLPFFPREYLGEKINKFILIDYKDQNNYLQSCFNILQSIIHYEEYKGKRQSCESADFYISLALDISNQLKEINVSIAPIINCLSKNYIGLCYLNAFYVKSKSISFKENRDYISYLNKAKNNFKEVINLSKNNLNDSLGLFEAFAQYNIARVYRNLGESADTSYVLSINRRDFLSKSHCFPLIFRLNFSLEKIHAEVDYNDYRLQQNHIDFDQYKENLENLETELKTIKTTPVLDVSLFKTLEVKITNKLNA